jgi:hypothetical protein
VEGAPQRRETAQDEGDGADVAVLGTLAEAEPVHGNAVVIGGTVAAARHHGELVARRASARRSCPLRTSTPPMLGRKSSVR